MLPFIPPSNVFRIVGIVDPDANTAGDADTVWIDMQDYGCLSAIVMAGDLGASATVDGKFRQATDASGTGAKDVTGRAITQLTKAGTDDNKQAIVNLRPEHLDRENGYRYAQFRLTTATATSDGAAIVLGFLSRYGVGDDLSSVDQIVA